MTRMLLIVGASAVAVAGTVAYAQTQPPNPLQLFRSTDARFQLLREDGIVQPDQHTFVPGTKVWTVTDKATGQCFVLFLVGTSTAVSGPTACQ